MCGSATFSHIVYGNAQSFITLLLSLNILLVKVSYFSKFSFLFHLMKNHSKDVNSKFWLKRLSRLDARRNFVYCSKLNYGNHNQADFHLKTNIFQTEHFSAAKFDMGYRKRFSFLVILKFPKVF